MCHTLLLNADGTPISQLPLSVITWQDALKLVYLEKVKVIKEYPDWVVHSQYLSINVPSIIISTQQIKWNRHIKFSKSNVFIRDDFTCQLQITNKCQNLKGKVKFTELTLDHITPKSKSGGTNWKNVCASCKNCNGVKGNDETIIPKKIPNRPTYYELLAKRRSLPIYIRDKEWNDYLGWPEDLVSVRL